LAGGAIEIGDHDGAEADFGAELGDSGGDGGLFSAGGEAVGGVLDVAAGDDLAGFEQDGGADVEVAVGGVGAVSGGFGLSGEVGEFSVGQVGHQFEGTRVGGGWQGVG